MNIRTHNLGALGAVLCLLAHSASAAADIRGAITTVTPAQGEAPASIFVEGPAPAGATEGPKALLYVTAVTKIFKQEGATRAAATFADLKVGAQVEGTFAPGPMLMIYPPRVTASEILILPGAAPAPAPAPPRGSAPAAPDIRDGAEVTITGTLAGGAMAVGGETTGWVLAFQTPQGVRTLEVDVKALSAPPPEGAVIVAGKIVTKAYVERGPTLILQAARISPVQRGSGGSGPRGSPPPPAAPRGTAGAPAGTPTPPAASTPPSAARP